MPDTPETESTTTEMTPEERRLANLRPPWRKGESGNTAGRPAGSRNRSSLLREMINLVAKDKDGTVFKSKLIADGIELTIEEAMEIRQLEKALEGNLDSYIEIKDSIYGKKVDKTSFTDPDGEDPAKNAWTVNIVDNTQKREIETGPPPPATPAPEADA